MIAGTLRERVALSTQLIGNVLPRYSVETRAAVVRWWDGLSNPVLIEGPFVTNRATGRRRRH